MTVSSWPGFFISLEGIDGAGKSTQGAALAGELSRSGRDVVTLRPSDTQLGDLVRGYLLQHHQVAIDPWTEALLFIAGRVQLLRERILPALQAGAVVIADRYADSTLAYQGAGRGLGVEAVRAINEFATGGLAADRTLLLAIDAAAGRRRRGDRGEGADRLERETDEFFTRIAAGYASLAAAQPGRIRTLDATLAPAALLEAALVELADLLE